MIQAMDVSKNFGGIRAIDRVSAEIKNGSVFGLIGSNGAGKSTFLRLAAGILKPDSGRIEIDGESIFENTRIKEKFFYISDEQFFYPNATPAEMKNFYAKIYTKFDQQRFHKLMKSFGLEENRKINTFSKGMKKQVSVICGVCAMTDYLFCDETFDGLDPVARQAVKAIFAGDVAERNMTPVIASHNLRELEDICDHVGLLHRGGILFSKDLDDMKLGIHKLQCVFDTAMKKEDFAPLEVMQMEQRGSLYTITARADRETVEKRLQEMRPVFFEILPLSLEEIFISETEVCGYDIKSLIL
ncbi:ABC transporter ATP-binding protein [Acidaminobacterium chupaoyuni]